MKKTMIKLAVFAGVFVVSLVIISFFMNKGNADMTAEMGPATLPTISVTAGGAQINLMHGYCGKMEIASMREGITPLGAERQVDAVIETYGQRIARAGYEVRSLDGERLIENTELPDPVVGEETLNVSFRLKDLIEEGEEYSLIFILTLEDGREVRYYTRVICAEYFLQEKLDFVRQFSDSTFYYERLREFGKYLEPNAEGDNSTLAKVNIHSSARQVAWGGLSVKQETKPRVLIREISPHTASIVLSYVVSYPELGATAYASVEEYYRVRYTAERMYLLDYERTMEQFFAETAATFTNDKINLGISDTDVEMMESDGGTVFAFSHAGALYSFNSADSRLSRLFAFYDDGRDDPRTSYMNHDFKILKVDETGNVTFLVYGYMNRGRHEGHCGVQVCYYSSTLNVVEEMAFIPYTKSADILRADMANLSYVNGKNDLFMMVDGNICHVSLEEKSGSVIASGLSEESYRVAADGSMLVWQKDGTDLSGTGLILMNLNTGEKSEINAGRDNYIRPLGFIGEDLIYGLAAREDVKEDILGHTAFLMHTIMIESPGGETLKTFHKEDYYVTGYSIEENQINLELVSRTEDGLPLTDKEQLIYSREVPDSRNYVEGVMTETLEKIAQIVIKSPVDSKKVKILTPREVLFEGSRDVELPEGEHTQRYYVYGKRGVMDIQSTPAAAVKQAYDNAGTVTVEDGSYIFKRDRLYTSNQIMAITGSQAGENESSLAVCLNAILKFEGLMRDSAYLMRAGENAMEVLSENLPERKILNLQGCSLDMMLYYPDRERPVLAVLADDSAVLITGFNEKNVVIMDPQTGKVSKMGKNDARTLFAENGNRFIAYW